MIVKTAEALRRITERILRAAGADESNAAQVADHLVCANLSGVDSHGIWHVLGYVQRIREGDVDPTAKPRVLRESPSSLLVGGSWTFGQVNAGYAMEKSIVKARDSGIAISGLVQSYHIGRLGHYVEMAAAEGMASMVFLGVQGAEHPTSVAYGGRQPVMHTNPVAIGFPGSNGEPAMMFDCATTALSGVKIVNARNRGQQLPPDCILDRHGNPSTDPADFFDDGVARAFGGHKGYGLMTAVEYLGRIFLRSTDFREPGRGWIYDAYSGTCMIVFRADLFHALEGVTSLAEEFAQDLRSSQPAPGFDEVLTPGDVEVRSRRERGRDGIPIEEDVWQTLIEAAQLVGIDDLH